METRCVKGRKKRKGKQPENFWEKLKGKLLKNLENQQNKQKQMKHEYNKRALSLSLSLFIEFFGFLEKLSSSFVFLSKTLSKFQRGENIS